MQMTNDVARISLEINRKGMRTEEGRNIPVFPKIENADITMRERCSSTTNSYENMSPKRGNKPPRGWVTIVIFAS